jgi:predicted nucleic acid-binding protein
LAVTKKLKNRKKIVANAQKFSMFMSPGALFEKTQSLSPSKTKKSLGRAFSQKSIFKPYDQKPTTPITGNRLYTIERLSGSNIMSSYDKLIRSCSETNTKKRFMFVKEKKTIRSISRNIKRITDDPEENLE